MMVRSAYASVVRGSVIRVDPRELSAAGINDGDRVDTYATADGAIIVKKYHPDCCVCHRSGLPLASFGEDPERHVCGECAARISQVLRFTW